MNRDMPNFVRGGVVGQVVSMMERQTATPMELPMPTLPAPISIPEVPAQKKPTDEILPALAALKIENPEISAKRDRLIAKRAELNRESEMLLDSQNQETREKNIARHAELRAKGREAEKELQIVVGEITEFTQAMNFASAKIGEVSADYQARVAERNSLRRFASDKEVADADAAIAKALAVLEKAEARKSQIMAWRNRLVTVELREKQKALTDVHEELTRLELKLTGRDRYSDPTLGIVGPVGSPEPRSAT